MIRSPRSSWSKNLSLTLTFAVSACVLFAGPVLAGDPDEDEVRFVRRVESLRDCPEIQVLGAGNVKVLSMSPRGFLGVETSSLTPELRRHFGVPEDAGVMVSRVVDDSAAQAAGLGVGDIITQVDGEDVATSGELGRAIRHRDGGETVEVVYWRDGRSSQTIATLEERERCAFDIGDYMDAIHLEDLPKLGDFGIEFSRESIESALESAREVIEGQNWNWRFEGLDEVELEHIEERMERVQDRLELLEERLEREYGRDRERGRERERSERDRERSERDRKRSERDRDDGSNQPI